MRPSCKAVWACSAQPASTWPEHPTKNILGVIVIIPALFAIWYLSRRTLADAFLSVYMTTLLVLPGWCRWTLPKSPDPMFDQAAILPIIAVFLFKWRGKWKFSLTDFLVVGLIAVMTLSEYVNMGFGEMQDLLFDMLAGGLFPYVLAKALTSGSDFRVRFAKRFVWSLVPVFITTLYEFRFALNPYRLVFDRFFPGQGAGWVVTFRYGFPRVAGPYGHAILDGIVFMAGLQLQLWLVYSQRWEKRFRWPVFNLPKPLSITLALITTLTICFTRGPQIGAVLGWIGSSPGRAPNPKRRALTLLILIVFIGIPVKSWFDSYVSVGRAGARSESQETAAYRKELMEKYQQIAVEKSVLGWGSSGWPKVAGMVSIDNYYLLLALMHGLIATALFTLILLSMAIRLFRDGMRNAPLPPPASSLSFTLFGIYIAIAFAIATAYIGLNVIPIFFMLTGFAEGHLVNRGDASLVSETIVQPAKAAVGAFQFQRVLG